MNMPASLAFCKSVPLHLLKKRQAAEQRQLFFRSNRDGRVPSIRVAQFAHLSSIPYA